MSLFFMLIDVLKVIIFLVSAAYLFVDPYLKNTADQHIALTLMYQYCKMWLNGCGFEP